MSCGRRALALASALISLAVLSLAASAAARGFEVAATGDVLTHGPVIDAARRAAGGWRFGRFFSHIRPLIRGADLAICHQETVLGPGRPRGYPLFRGPAAIARAEARAGWDACSTASNHSYDHGEQGIFSTLTDLDRAGIAHAGTYSSRRDSDRPRLIHAAGHTVALLAYTEFVNRSGYGSPPWQPERIRLARIVRDAHRARQAGAEAVIVNLHWGTDVEPRPGHRRVRLVRELLAHRSISAIIGQGAHLVWPIRFFHGKPAVLGEGNLLYQPDPHGLGWHESGILAFLRFRERGDELRAESVRYVPLTQRRRDLALVTALDPGGAASPALERRIRSDYRHATAVIGRAHGLRPMPGRLDPPSGRDLRAGRR